MRQLFMPNALIWAKSREPPPRIMAVSTPVMETSELIYAGVLSSGIAFMLQVFGQQNLSPAPVAIIFSLEGVFGSIAAWIVLDQYLNEFKIFIAQFLLIIQFKKKYESRSNLLDFITGHCYSSIIN